MKKLKIGIIGCGRILPMHIVPATLLPYSELICVCDIKKERADETAKEYNCKAYYDYKTMLEKEKLDAVHICLPHYLHAVVSSYCLERNVNVLCEKPMSINYEDGEKCVNIALKNNIKYGIIFQCRYNESSVLVKNELLSGRLGKIISCSSVLTWKRPDDYYLQSDWKGTWDKEGGGVIIDQAIHSIDLVNWFINDEVIEISCSIANRGHKSVKVEDSAEGLITYKNGVKYGFYCMNNYGCDEPIEIKLLCENGKVKLTYDYAEIKYNNGDKKYAETPVPDIDYKGGKDYWGFQHIKQIEQFYRACLGLEELELSGAEILKTQKLISNIYKNAKRFNLD